MEVEITPEPSPEEREAIVKALAETAATDSRSPTGAWWREGLREAVLGDAELESPEP